MDTSINSQGTNGTHPQQAHHGSSYGSFIDEMHSYAGQADSNNDEYQFSWDPALFAAAENIGSPFSQQPPQQTQPQHAGFNQAMSRQTNSNPVLPQFQPSQQSQQPQHSPSPYPQNNYQPQHFEPRASSQPLFDERFLARPSNSPIPFEQYHHYQAPIHFNAQPYNQVQPTYQQQRQVAPSNAQYSQPQRPVQQTNTQYMNIAPARPSVQNPQIQNPGGMFHQFQAKPNVPHSFIDPSMLSSNNLPPMNGANHNVQQRSNVQQSPYFPMSNPAHPQMFQQMQMPKISPSPVSIQPALPTRVEQGVQIGHTQVPPQQIGSPGKVAKEAEAAGRAKPKTLKAKKDSTGALEQSSADELEIEDEPPEMTPAILCVSAPTEFRSKVLYNIVQAVWSPRNKPATPEKVRSGVAAFGETIRSLRDAWKEKNEALKKAELPNSPAAAHVPALKDDVAHFRSAMELAMQRSLQYGHDSIIKRLGENQFTLSALYSFMLDRANAGDHDSSLVTNIFKFAVRFETLDEEMLETVKWTKILQRFTKKATNESKGLAKQILANATIQSAKKRSAKVDGTPGSPGSIGGGPSASGLKRPRDGEALPTVTKKVVRAASKPLALQHAEKRKALEKENAAKLAAKTDKSDAKLATAATSRPKVAMAAPQKTSAFAGLLSASKKPGTSLAEKAAAAKEKPKIDIAAPLGGLVATVKKEDGRRESPPRASASVVAKPTSSFLGFLADMEKPKESEPKKVQDDPDETEDQRAKRLRKEARRKLRVTWKADADLVETRLFTHDPDEETGHADSMMRDAGDTMKEGEMLKLHKGVEDLEDDEDDEVPDDLVEYIMPTEVDFSEIEQERSMNYIKFAGLLQPTSPASEGQDKYEENTLMAIYTFKSDRPDTPKELPSVNEDDDFSPSIDFGEPDEKVRRREKEILARRQSQVKAPNTVDLAAQLRAMGQPQQPPAHQPGLGGFDLQRTLSMLSQPSHQPSAPPAAVPVAGGLDLAKLFAVVQQANQMQQTQLPPQYNAPASTQTGVPANLAAIVAQVQQHQSLPTGSGGNPNPFPGNDASRKHDRGDDLDSSGKRKKAKVPIGPDGKPLNYKTLVCNFYQQGKCIKGDNCTYRHDE